ncbi:MAG: hypothetical protein OES47_14445, partial [Acidobacteriota bacterium]|nr:hypothetical protein [Acidobacteriota bacterium]
MRSTTGIAAITLGIAFLQALSVEAQTHVVRSSVGPRGLALLAARDGYQVETPEGESTPLNPAQGSRLSALSELPTGWIVAGERLIEDGGELILLTQEAGARRAIIEPEGRFGFRRAPVLFVDQGQLAGLAWLEGDGGEMNAVMSSRRTDDGWEGIQIVSPFSGHAQLAPAGAVLEDGSWLLVWAAVDGEDDEIMWSRFDGSAWSPAARLHPDNSVPDIVPAVTAVSRGALVAWSQDDGKDYRLKIARFEHGTWRDTGFVGEEGSLYPTVFATGNSGGFFYQTVTPREWVLLEV